MKTETFTSRTPLPWSVGGHPRDNSGTDWREILAPSPFGPMYVGQALERDAKLIVQAVNNHATLVAALKAFQEGFADGSIKWTKRRWYDTDTYHPANTAMCAAFDKLEATT